MVAANLYRGCAKPVLGKDACGDGAWVKGKKGQIAAVCFANARFGHTDAHTCYWHQRLGVKG